EVTKSPAAPRVPDEAFQGEGRTPSQPLVHALTLKSGYVCSYVDPMTQKRCDSTFALEIDHRSAWSEGGQTKLSNLRYLCRNHHRRVSFLKFGESSKYFRQKQE